MKFELTKSYILIDDIEIPSIFSNIYDEDGFMYVEVHFKDDTFKDILEEKRKKNYWAHDVEFYGETVKSDYVHAYGLTLNTLKPYNKARFFVYDRLEHFKYNSYDESIKKVISNKEAVYCIEVENLELQHSSMTERKEYKDGKEINKFKNFDFNYTSTLLVSDLKLKENGNNVNVNFHVSEKKNTVQINFLNHDEIAKLTYGEYVELKEYLVNLLSFLNGGKVRVSKEYCGSTYNIEVPRTEIEIYYSYTKQKSKNKSEFIPIGNHSNRSTNILNHVLLKFDNYVEAEDKYGLKQLIHSLNSLNDVNSYTERFKILIIALESISHRVQSAIGKEPNSFFVSNDDFKTIKQELLEVVKKHKKELSIEQYEKLSSKVGMLNENSKGVVKKLNFFIDYCGINRTVEINNLIEKVRHSSVHEGLISKDEQEAFKLYTILDDILRYSILCLIKYNSIYNPYSGITIGVKDNLTNRSKK
jgi:hypothetical protein